MKAPILLLYFSLVMIHQKLAEKGVVVFVQSEDLNSILERDKTADTVLSVFLGLDVNSRDWNWWKTKFNIVVEPNCWDKL